MTEGTTDPREPGDREIPEHRQTETVREPAMGDPGTLPSDRSPIAKARHAAGGRLQDAGVRVREMGDRVAAKNRFLEPTRPLANNAAARFDHAADYVRTREIDQMKEDLETTVRRHPLASIAAAFIAGYTVRRIF